MKRIVAALVVALALAVAACGGSTNSSARVSTTSSAKMTMAQWWSNCGSSGIQGINQDLGQVQQDINYGIYPVNDVQRLGADAQSVLTQEPLPPADPADFKGWIDSIIQAASSVEDGVNVVTAFQMVEWNGSAHLRAFQTVAQSYGLQFPSTAG